LRAMRAAAPARPLSVIGRVIEAYAKRFGYGVVRDFGGHGIGESFHSGLFVPHYDNPRLETVMEPGMTFTIEPMITLGTYKHDMWNDGWTGLTKDRKWTAQFAPMGVVPAQGHEMWNDGWTVLTKDRKWTAQFEHMVVVTDSGYEILTLP